MCSDENNKPGTTPSSSTICIGSPDIYNNFAKGEETSSQEKIRNFKLY